LINCGLAPTMSMTFSREAEEQGKKCSGRWRLLFWGVEVLEVVEVVDGVEGLEVVEVLEVRDLISWFRR